jgi:indole-3-glycerol phosphate synthase/phosphoribosylanthranilate isomerase
VADVLGSIVAHKRIEVAERLRGFDGSNVAPTSRSLRSALARPGARFIMEVKRASPSAIDRRIRSRPPSPPTPGLRMGSAC